MAQAVAVKKLLYLVRRPPYGNLLTLEFIDAMLVGAVFEQKVSVLFSGAGVWQLLRSQNSAPMGLKNLAQQLSVLPEYDVTDLFVCASSLAQRQLEPQALVLPVTLVSHAEQRSLLAAQDVVFND